MKCKLKSYELIDKEVKKVMVEKRKKIREELRIRLSEL